MLVCILNNYDYPNLERQLPNNVNKWGDIEFVFNPVDECDYLVVLNKPEIDISVKCRKGGKWLIIQEPPIESNNHYTKYFKYFDKIYSQFPNKYLNIISSQTCLPWHIDKSYDELVKSTPQQLNKSKDISWITSNKLIHSGHAKRMAFLDKLQSVKMDFDLFGRGFSEISDKSVGLDKYKYTLAIENYITQDYWTEKIADSFLSYCMPIYSGCTNISEYFPEESMILINIDNIEESLEIINKSISDNLWVKNIDSIKHSRELILNKYQLFPFLENLINQDLESNKINKLKHFFIPKTGRNKIGNLLNKTMNFLHVVKSKI